MDLGLRARMREQTEHARIRVHSKDGTAGAERSEVRSDGYTD